MAVLASILMALSSASGLADAVSLYEAGQYRKAAEMLHPMASASGAAADVHLWLGKSYLRLRRWDDAIRTLETASAVEPGNAVCRLWLGRAYGEKASRASIFAAYGLARKVVREFEAAVRLAPGNMDARFDLLRFYLEAPGIVGGGRTKAEAEVRAIADRSPRLGCSARAAMYERDKKWEQCRLELVHATSEFPADAGAFVDLAEFLLRRGDFGGAEPPARAAIRLDPGRKGARLLLAAVSIELRKELPEAERILANLAGGPLGDEDPSFSDVYFWLGRARTALARPQQARHAFEQALRFDPEHAGAKSALAGM